MTDSALVELAEVLRPAPFWSAVGRLVHGAATVIGYAILAAFAVALVHDQMLRFNSVEMHRNVSEWVTAGDRPLDTTALLTEQDFDGDGVLDKAFVIEHRVDPAIGMGIWKLLIVKSGSTGESLLIHGLGIIERVEGWCGDYDGNGTVDLMFTDHRDHVVLGYVEDSQ